MHAQLLAMHRIFVIHGKGTLFDSDRDSNGTARNLVLPGRSIVNFRKHGSAIIGSLTLSLLSVNGFPN